MNNFIPLLLGNDINSYSLARAFNEAYGVTSQVFCKTTHGPCGDSRLCSLTVHPDIDLAPVLVPMVQALAQQNLDKTILILGCGDNYIEPIILNRHQFPKNVVVPYISAELLSKLMAKRDFYTLCAEYGLEFPQAVFYTPDMGEDFDLPFGYPLILKPSDSVTYWHNPFPTQKKAYVVETREELVYNLNEVYKHGYTDVMIIQEMIPGDDSCLRVMTCLSGRDSRTIFAAMGHPLLEEHTPHGVGNTSFILSDYDPQLAKKICDFLEHVGYVGFSNFDMKRDPRDGRIKIFEINCRQGRNNYYVTGGGLNIAQYITDEFVLNRKNPFVMPRQDILWTVVPLGVAYRFVKDRSYIPRVKALVKAKKVVNPLFKKGDLSLRRLAFLLKSHFSHYVKYFKYYK